MAGLFVRPLAEVVVRLLRFAEDVDDHFVLAGCKVRCQTPKCSAVRRAHRSRSARNTLNNLRLAFRSVESGKYNVASLVTSYMFFFMRNVFL